MRWRKIMPGNLPPPGEDVLVSEVMRNKKRRTYVAYRPVGHDDYWFSQNERLTPTHWQPLPEDPE